MAENSKIEWTDHTFNPWEGCQKVGPGCDHCYAEARNARFGGGAAPNWGPGAPRRLTSASNWRKPLKWQADAARFFGEHGRRQRVFCASLADVFDNAVEDMWRADLANLISDTPDLDWLLLTKRIGNAAEMLQIAFDGDIPPNVWLGATVVNQEEADRDIPKLLAVPARVRFLSMEPLLGPVDLRKIVLRGDGQFPTKLSARLGDYVQPLSGNFRDSPKLHWVIVGGESGKDARPMHPAWARSLRDQCAATGVPFLFKQWGEFEPYSFEKHDYTRFDPTTSDAAQHVLNQGEEPGAENIVIRVGKKAAGRLLDNATHDGFPPTQPPSA